MFTRGLILLLFFYKANCEISMKVKVHVFSVEVTIDGLSDGLHNCTFSISHNDGVVDKCQNCTSCVYHLFENLNPETSYTVKYNLHEDPSYNDTLNVKTEEYLMKIYHENPYNFVENVTVVPSAFGAGECLARCMAFDIDLFNCLSGFCNNSCDNLDFQFNFTQTTDVLCIIKTKDFPKQFNFSFTAERTFPAVTDVFSEDGESLVVIMKSTDKFRYDTNIFLSDVVTDNTLNNTVLKTPETRVYFGNLTNEATYKVVVTFLLFTPDCLERLPGAHCTHTDSVTLTLYNPSDLKPPSLNVSIAPDDVSIVIPHPKKILALFGNVTCYIYVYGRIKSADNINKDITNPEDLKTLQVDHWGFINKIDSLTCKSEDASYFKPEKVTYLSRKKDGDYNIQVGAVFIICENTRCYTSDEYKYTTLGSLYFSSTHLTFTTFVVLFSFIIMLYLIFLYSTSDQYSGAIKTETYQVALEDDIKTVKK